MAKAVAIRRLLIVRRATALAVTSTLLFLPLTCIGFRNQVGTQARISIAPKHVRLEPAPRGTTVTGDFVITNHGEQSLEFEVTASCGCLNVDPPSGFVLPDASQRITSTIKIDQLDRDVRLTIRSNDPRRPVEEVVINATAIQPLIASSRAITFGKYLIDDEALHLPTKRILRLSATDQGSLRNSVTVTCAADWLRAVPVDEESSTWEIQAYPESLTPGCYTSTLLISREGFTEALSVAVSIEVTNLLSLIPSELYFRGVGVDNARTFVVRRNDNGSLGRLLFERLPSSVRVAELAASRQDIRVYKIWLAGAAADDVFSLHFDGMPQSIDVTVRQADPSGPLSQFP